MIGSGACKSTHQRDMKRIHTKLEYTERHTFICLDRVPTYTFRNNRRTKADFEVQI